jgi:hypothetical protein
MSSERSYSEWQDSNKGIHRSRKKFKIAPNEPAIDEFATIGVSVKIGLSVCPNLYKSIECALPAVDRDFDPLDGRNALACQERQSGNL